MTKLAKTFSAKVIAPRLIDMRIDKDSYEECVLITHLQDDRGRSINSVSQRVPRVIEHAVKDYKKYLDTITSEARSRSQYVQRVVVCDLPNVDQSFIDWLDIVLSFDD